MLGRNKSTDTIAPKKRRMISAITVISMPRGFRRNFIGALKMGLLYKMICDEYSGVPGRFKRKMFAIGEQYGGSFFDNRKIFINGAF